MKKLIGLLAVAFVANTAQVFAKECKVGDKGPGGGYIFYCGDVKDKVQDPTALRKFTAGCKGKCIGLEAAPSDQDKPLPWGPICVSTGAIGEEIGDGMDNTLKIMTDVGITAHKTISSDGSLDGDYAALSCYWKKTDNGNNWFLPSGEELNLMYMNLYLKGVGDFSYNWYWSSSEYYEVSAWFQYFYNGHKHLYNKRTRNNVRCARAF